MKLALLTNLILIFLSSSIFAQEKKPNNSETDLSDYSNKSKSVVVVNKKFIAKYEKFMSDGEYVSLWETVKDYTFKEMSGYYKTYNNYEFTDKTTYQEVKLAYEKEKENLNLAEESKPLKKENESELLTKSE